MGFSLPAFLEVAIGLVFIYLIISLLASEIQELFAGFWQWRAKHLKKSIYLMLSGKGIENERELEKLLTDNNKSNSASEESSIIKLIQELYDHYEISSLKQSSLGFNVFKAPDGSNKFGPSYIPPESFAEAFIDILADKYNDSNLNLDLITKLAQNSLNVQKPAQSQTKKSNLELPEELKNNLLKFANKALTKRRIFIKDNNNLDNLEPEKISSVITQFKTEIETWFQRSQERTSGTYKRNSKIVLFFIGFIAAILANADTFHIIENLHDESVREAIVTQASGIVTECQDKQGEELSTCLEEKVEPALELNDLPIGWSNSSGDSGIIPFILRFLGYTVTALAIMMGASFWFDLLKKLVNVRNAGPKPTSGSSSPEVTTINMSLRQQTDKK